MTRPTPSASYRPHSISRVEPNITRARRSRAARIAPKREVLLSVPAIFQGTRSLININMRLLHRVEVQECQLRAVTINLHQVLLFLACWGACVRPADSCSYTWNLRNAVEDILHHSAHLGDNDENDNDSETEAWAC